MVNKRNRISTGIGQEYFVVCGGGQYLTSRSEAISRSRVAYIRVLY